MKKVFVIMLLLYIIGYLYSSAAEEITISGLLSDMYIEGLEELPFGMEEEDLYIMDGVLFGKNVLLLYPSWLENEQYGIPEGVEYVFDVAFCGNEYLETVTIPASCHVLGNGAFSDCTALRRVIFAEHSELLIIDDYCFVDCFQLESFSFPDSLYIIGYEAFSSTNIKRIVFPRSIALIKDYAFVHTPVTSIDFHPDADPAFVGKNSFDMSSTDPITITLPFDADVSKYFADPDEIENMEGIIIAYHEEE